MRRLVPVLLALIASVALALPAGASHTPPQVLGRNAVTYTSYPNDPTPTSKWASSSQGEFIDAVADNGIRDSLRGRGADLETYGIIRFREDYVRLQVLTGEGWQTRLARETDGVTSQARAYGIIHTPPGLVCRTDPTLTDTYRVVHSVLFRRVDNIVGRRTLTSHPFTARRLAADPGCPETPPPPPPPPTANLEIDAQGPTTLQHEQVADLDVLVSNDGASAGTVTAVVDFTAGLAVVAADSRCVLRTSTADPNDYTCNLGIFGDDETANLDFDVEGDTVGAQAVVVSVSGTGTADVDSDTLAVQVVESADLSLHKDVTGIDRDPATAGLQAHPGDTLTYRFEINSNPTSANLATNVVVVDNWPTQLGTPTIVSGATGGLDASGNLVLQFGTLTAGTTEVALVTTTVDATVTPDSTVTNTATIRSDQADPDTADRTDTATFRAVVAPAA